MELTALTVQLIFLGTPAFAVPTLGSTRRGRPRSARRGHPARPAQRPRPGAGGVSGERSRAAARTCPSISPSASAARKPSSAPRGFARRTPWWWSATARSFRNPSSISRRYGIINVHASLLPKYRGAAPIQWAIANGETRHRRHHHADRRGPRHRRHAAASRDRNRPGGNGRRTGRASGGAWARTCWSKRWRASNRRASCREKQDPAQATYAPMLKKEDGRSTGAAGRAAIHNRVRGLQPWPGAYTTFRGQTLHIWKVARRARSAARSSPGRLRKTGKSRGSCRAAKARSNCSKCSSKARSE